MLFYEVKKLMQGKLCKGSFIIAVFIILALFCSILSQNGFYTSNGEYKTGIKAAQNVMAKRKELSNLMNDDLILNMRKKQQALFLNPKNLNEHGDLKEAAYGKYWQKYDSLYRLWLVSGGKENVADMFEERNRQMYQVLSRNDEFGKPLYSLKEKQRALRVDKQLLDTKKTLYEDGEAWNILLNNMHVISLCIAIITLVIASILFSKEREANTDALLYTSKLGRSKDIIVKITAVFLLMSFLFVLMHGLFLGLVLMAYSSSGWNTILQYQAQYWLCIFPLTNVQAYGCLLGLGYFGCMCLACIAMLISRCTCKVYHSLIVSLLFFLVPALIPSLFLSPWSMLEGNHQLMSISIQTIMGKPVFHYELQLMLCEVCLLLLFPLYCSFRFFNRCYVMGD